MGLTLRETLATVDIHIVDTSQAMFYLILEISFGMDKQVGNSVVCS
jgi:hypothetical protein